MAVELSTVHPMEPLHEPTAVNTPAVSLVPQSALVDDVTSASTALGNQDDPPDTCSNTSFGASQSTHANDCATPGELLVHIAEGVVQNVGSAESASAALIAVATDTKEYPGSSQMNPSSPTSTSSPLTSLEDMNREDSNLALPQQPLNSPPHDIHPPDDIEFRRNMREMEQREVQVAALKDKIAEHNERLRNMQEKELEDLRPIMDELHGKICAIQHEMARRWTDYTSRMAKAQECTQQQIAELQQQIGDLEQDTSNSESSPAPILRLPAELLAEIFGVVIGCREPNRFAIMRVCRSWHATVLSMARVWSRFTVRPWTSLEQIEFLVERTKQVPLDVVVDLNPTRYSFMNSTKANWGYRGLALAVTTMARWRTLTVAAFPSDPDISAASEGEGGSPVTFSGPLEGLEAFKITGICETSAPFNRLLDTVATTSTERLTYIEISTPNALWYFASPNYHSLFSRLRHFKVDVREMRDPADILPSFENLEVLEAYRLHLPSYNHDVDLPIVRTLRKMNIKIVSVQWMSGRTFASLEDCTIIWPHHPETLCLQGGVDLPVCTQFTYDDHLIEPMSEFRVPKLDKMVVRNEAWNEPRGSAQLASVWGESMNPRWLRPRILHLDTQCYDQSLINALQLHPDLEELVLGLVRPDGLGMKFFNHMVARRLKGTSSLSVSPLGPAQLNEASSDVFVAPLVPRLKVFGLRYRRWIREREKDEIKPMLEKIILSREKTEDPLQSVKFWPTKDTPEADAEELVPPRE